MGKPLAFSAFLMNTASHILHGLWRDEAGEQLHFNNIELWVSLAKQLEEGGFDAMFFADVVGLYGDYNGDWKFHVENGLQIPSNDPLVLISALATQTKKIGLAFTAAPLQEPPFNFARRVSTLDHISNGRVGWNIVTSALENAARNFGHDGLTKHDERYEWAAEYVDVLYKLWEGSWDEGALLQNRVTGIYTDTSKVHKIHHTGERYQVEGPHLVSPSPQRTPVLFQAGSSDAGKNFASRHAEAVFIMAPSPEKARLLIEETRQRAVENGRHAQDIQFYQGLYFVIGDTEEEAQQKALELESKIDANMIIAHAAGGMGIDLGHLSLDTPIDYVETEGTRSIFNWLQQSLDGQAPVVGDLAKLRSKLSRVVGTPESIAQQLAKWQEAGVDGINVINATIPGSYTEFIEKVLPILRERGLAKPLDTTAQTFRDRLFGSNHLSERHPAAQYRGAFSNKEKVY